MKKNGIIQKFGEQMKQKKILVTGGAGFIGSNIVKTLLNDDRVSLVRILDNLSTGSRKNIEEFFDHPKFDFDEQALVFEKMKPYLVDIWEKSAVT